MLAVERSQRLVVPTLVGVITVLGSVALTTTERLSMAKFGYRTGIIFVKSGVDVLDWLLSGHELLTLSGLSSTSSDFAFLALLSTTALP